MFDCVRSDNKLEFTEELALAPPEEEYKMTEEDKRAREAELEEAKHADLPGNDDDDW